MASNFEAKTGAALMFNTLIEYLLTTDDVEGDPANLVESSNFGGKINLVLQAFFDNLNYLKNEIENVDMPTKANQTQGRSGTDDEHFITSLRLLDFLRKGTGAGADTTRKGTSQRATQAEVNQTTNPSTSKHLTPATFQGSAAIRSIAPATSLPTFYESLSPERVLNFTSEIIGNFGIFKHDTGNRNASLQDLIITSDNWIPLLSSDIYFYNSSSSRMSVQDIEIRAGLSIGKKVYEIDLGNIISSNDIVYIPMIKVR